MTAYNLHVIAQRCDTEMLNANKADIVSQSGYVIGEVLAICKYPGGRLSGRKIILWPLTLQCRHYVIFNPCNHYSVIIV